MRQRRPARRNTSRPWRSLLRSEPCKHRARLLCPVRLPRGGRTVQEGQARPLHDGGRHGPASLPQQHGLALHLAWRPPPRKDPTSHALSCGSAGM